MDNYIVKITDDNIKFRFELEGHVYALIGDADDNASDGNAYLVELVESDDKILVRAIESDETYAKVKKEFERRMEDLESVIEGDE